MSADRETILVVGAGIAGLGATQLRHSHAFISLARRIKLTRNFYPPSFGPDRSQMLAHLGLAM